MATYFKDCDRVAQQAARDITAWLEKNKFQVENVEHDTQYQEQDIDLLAHRNGSTVKIEIKGDNHYHTGNFYCETISNTTKGTLGCFLQTQSDRIYYYYPAERVLCIIPTREAQEWLLANKHNYRKASVSTTDKAGNIWYKNEGYLIPRKDMIQAIGCCMIRI